MDGESNLCYFCKNVSKKYTCPRCNSNYCSLVCFQSPPHIQCSESFYQNCVLDNLSSGTADDEAKERMLDVLKQFHTDSEQEKDTLDSDDEAEELSLAERLTNIDLDDTKEVWKRLNSDERQEFEAFLRSGEVTKFVPKWEPWWTIKIPKIKEMGEVYEDKCPKVLDNIKQLTSLTNKPPSECVKYNVMNVLSAYVFMARYFNGDYYDFVDEAVGCVTYLSLCLKDNKNFGSEQEAVHSVQERCFINEWISVDEENINVMKDDVSLVMDGEFKCHKLSALSDLHRLMTTFLGGKKGKGNNFMQNCPVYKVNNKDIKIYLKKIEYFLSYVLYVVNNKVNT